MTTLFVSSEDAHGKMRSRKTESCAGITIIVTTKIIMVILVKNRNKYNNHNTNSPNTKTNSDK